MEHPSARDLIDRCASGAEPLAWACFVERYGPAIECGVRRALRRVGEPAPDAVDRQDLIQECYCRLLERDCRRLVSLRACAEPEVRGWLVRFAERSTRDRLRWARAEKRSSRRSISLAAPGRSGRLPDPVGSPERLAIGRQTLRQFARRCRRLAPNERDARILWLVFFAGLTSREVAAMSQGALSPSSVDSIVYRFRRRLARKGLPVPTRTSAGSFGPRRRGSRPARMRLARPAPHPGLQSFS